MKFMNASAAAALLALGIQAAQAKDPAPLAVRPAAVRQASPGAPAMQPAAPPQGAGVEELPPEAAQPAPGTGESDDPLKSETLLRGSGIPSSPYPAGLSYMMTPQPFRVPYPDRIYYPPRHYVHQCPYYPSGVYWGADWYKRILGHNPWLIHGCKRFNPYLTEAKIRHHTGRRAAPAGAPGCYGAMPAGAPGPDFERLETLVSKPTPPRAEAEANQASEEEEAETPPLPQIKLIAEPKPNPTSSPTAEAASPPPSAKSTARMLPAQSARRTLPAWQRPPAVRR